MPRKSRQCMADRRSPRQVTVAIHMALGPRGRSRIALFGARVNLVRIGTLFALAGADTPAVLCDLKNNERSLSSPASKFQASIGSIPSLSLGS
jgi:hypothetical protein